MQAARRGRLTAACVMARLESHWSPTQGTSTWIDASTLISENNILMNDKQSKHSTPLKVVCLCLSWALDPTSDTVKRQWNKTRIATPSSPSDSVLHLIRIAYARFLSDTSHRLMATSRSVV